VSIAINLRKSHRELTEKLAGLVKSINVRFSSYPPGAIGFPDHHWGELDAIQRKTQLDLKREFGQWTEIMDIVLMNAPKQINRKLKIAKEKFSEWIEFGSNWSINENPEHNEMKMREDAERFNELFDILDVNGSETVFIIPDTNSLIKQPDPAHYRSIVGEESFSMLLLPSVLSELDKLKNLHKNIDFREKVKKVIDRVKGWRIQGSLLDGVIVDNSIIIRAIPREPNMELTLSWLDNTIIDDRIIASVLEIASTHPASRVVLSTADINLQNKAELAKIECVDI